MVETILGQVPSKSNCYKIITLSGHGSLAKTKALKDYEKSFYLQCRSRNKFTTKLFELHVDVYNSSQRPDLDNSFKIILDCLQQCKVIDNDRNCVKIVAQKFVDKINPRVEFKLIET